MAARSSSRRPSPRAISTIASSSVGSRVGLREHAIRGLRELVRVGRVILLDGRPVRGGDERDGADYRDLAKETRQRRAEVGNGGLRGRLVVDEDGDGHRGRRRRDSQHLTLAVVLRDADIARSQRLDRRLRLLVDRSDVEHALGGLGKEPGWKGKHPEARDEQPKPRNIGHEGFHFSLLSGALRAARGSIEPVGESGGESREARVERRHCSP